MRYKTDKQAREALIKHIKSDDSGFCTVIATAQVTDCSMSKAYHTNKKFGRPHRKGMKIENHLEALKSLGWTARLVFHRQMGDKLTVNQAIQRLNDNKIYLIYIANQSSAHVITYREGQIRDWHAETHKGKAIRKGVYQVVEMTKV